MSTLFITGIDTNIGKTYATAAIAKALLSSEKKVFTQKLIETGCGIDNKQRFSHDLNTHEKLIGKIFNTEAYNLHAPYLFKHPASPHLSAELESTTINTSHLKQSISKLQNKCDHLLIEGAGGLCVPINSSETIADFVYDLNLPIVLVTSPRLGSINHTLLTIEFCLSKGIDIHSIIYNLHDEQSEYDPLILDSTRNTLKFAIRRYSEKSEHLIKWFELDNTASLTPHFKL